MLSLALGRRCSFPPAVGASCEVSRPSLTGHAISFLFVFLSLHFTNGRTCFRQVPALGSHRRPTTSSGMQASFCCPPSPSRFHACRVPMTRQSVGQLVASHRFAALLLPKRPFGSLHTAHKQAKGNEEQEKQCSPKAHQCQRPIQPFVELYSVWYACASSPNALEILTESIMPTTQQVTARWLVTHGGQQLPSATACPPAAPPDTSHVCWHTGCDCCEGLV